MNVEVYIPCNSRPTPIEIPVEIILGAETNIRPVIINPATGSASVSCIPDIKSPYSRFHPII